MIKNIMPKVPDISKVPKLTSYSKPQLRRLKEYALSDLRKQVFNPSKIGSFQDDVHARMLEKLGYEYRGMPVYFWRNPYRVGQQAVLGQPLARTMAKFVAYTQNKPVEDVAYQMGKRFLDRQLGGSWPWVRPETFGTIARGTSKPGLHLYRPFFRQLDKKTLESTLAHEWFHYKVPVLGKFEIPTTIYGAIAGKNPSDLKYLYKRWERMVPEALLLGAMGYGGYKLIKALKDRLLNKGDEHERQF